jgi:hypothetical protein
MDDGSQQTLSKPALPDTLSTEVFQRSGRIRRIELVLGSGQLFSE